MQGRIERIEVLEGGRVVYRDDNPKTNLINDAGLDAIAVMPIPEIFRVAIKGVGTDPNVEHPANTNTYSRSANSSTVTRTAGTRDFTADDVGKLIKFDDTAKSEAIILTYNTASNVSVDRTSSTAITNKHITSIYAVNQTSMSFEYGMKEYLGGFSYENVGLYGPTISSDTSEFVAADVGKYIFLPDLGAQFKIIGLHDSIGPSFTNAEVEVESAGADGTSATGFIFTGGTEFTQNLTNPISRTDVMSAVDGENGTTRYPTTDTANRNKQILKRTHIFDPEIEKVTTVANTNVFSIASNGKVTRTAGARNFTAGDLGYVISVTDGTNTYEGKITNIDSTTVVSTTHTGDIATGLEATLYGFETYTEIGYTNYDANLLAITPATPLNIRVLLDTPVDAQAPTALAPGQQLKVTYSMEVTVGPSVSTSGLAPIYDPTAALSANKNGVYCVETLALAAIGDDGETLTDLAGLEPSIAGVMGLTTDIAALAPLQNKIRIASIETADLELGDYTPPSNGAYKRTSLGSFALNQGIGSWRSLILYDEESTQSLFCFLFTAAQVKDGNHALNLTFTKTWDRNLAS